MHCAASMAQSVLLYRLLISKDFHLYPLPSALCRLIAIEKIRRRHGVVANWVIELRTA
jgi:hypothetical protein